MVTVSHVLQGKGKRVWTIEPGATVREALDLMSERDIGALVVVEHGRVVGMFSERDYARKVILKGRASNNTPVRDVMSSKVYYVGPERHIEECMALMTDRAVRHLPVMLGDDLVGIISIGDVVKAVIAKQEFIIDQLEQFIVGASTPRSVAAE